MTLGVYGHFGQEEYDGHGKFVSNSLGTDLTLGFSKKAEIKSEVWFGKNLDAYLGGIGQGMNRANTKPREAGYKEIHAQGGWVCATAGPFGKLKVYGGAGLDDPNDEDLNPADRARNVCVWAGISYNVESATRVGVEGSYFETQYVGLSDVDGTRGQISVVYEF